jgi:hypothetical protein
MNIQININHNTDKPNKVTVNTNNKESNTTQQKMSNLPILATFQGVCENINDCHNPIPLKENILITCSDLHCKEQNIIEYENQIYPFLYREDMFEKDKDKTELLYESWKTPTYSLRRFIWYCGNCYKENVGSLSKEDSIETNRKKAIMMKRVIRRQEHKKRYDPYERIADVLENIDDALGRIVNGVEGIRVDLFDGEISGEIDVNIRSTPN